MSQVHDPQAADIAELKAEFEFRSRQLCDLGSYARLADMPPQRHAESLVLAKYIESRDAYLAMVTA